MAVSCNFQSASVALNLTPQTPVSGSELSLSELCCHCSELSSPSPSMWLQQRTTRVLLLLSFDCPWGQSWDLDLLSPGCAATAPYPLGLSHCCIFSSQDPCHCCISSSFGQSHFSEPPSPQVLISRETYTCPPLSYQCHTDSKHICAPGLGCYGSSMLPEPRTLALILL